jgi:DNA-binding CsgD family transcriptional regulator
VAEHTSTIEVPARTLWRLMSIADKRGVKVVDLLNELAGTGTGPGPQPGQPRLVLTRQQRVAVLHAKGFTARQIANELGIHRENVYYHLARLELKPHPVVR